MLIKIVAPQETYAELLNKWRNEPAAQKYNPIKYRTLEELRQGLKGAPTTLALVNSKLVYRWFIDFQDEIVGTVSLSEINEMMGTAEIGYMVGEAHYGRGIATLAVREWTSMIYELTDLRKLTASVAEQNLASIRVLEKVGFKKEGLLREHYLIQNKPTNELVFGLLRKEWI